MHFLFYHIHEFCSNILSIRAIVDKVSLKLTSNILKFGFRHAVNFKRTKKFKRVLMKKFRRNEILNYSKKKRKHTASLFFL